jgi:multiple sugar transport system substrate-binding protein
MISHPESRWSRRALLQASAIASLGVGLTSCALATPVAPAGATAMPVEATPPSTVPAAAGTVVVMHFRHELTEDQEKQFEEDNPGIEIEFLNADAVRFFAMYAAGNPPDLLRTQAPSIPQYLARKMLYDLTPFFEVSEVLRPADLAPANDYYKANSPLEIGKGRIYGMVKDWSPDFTLFAYDKAFADAGLPLLDDAKPITYEEIYSLAKQLARFEGDRVVMWGYGYGDWWVDRIWMNMLAELGQGLYSEDFSKMNLTGNDEAKKVVKYYFDLAKENLVANPLNPSPSWNGEDFTKGTLALLQYGYWFSAMAESDVTRGQVRMLPAPTWAGVRRDPTMTATGMVMAAVTKVPQAAWKVFEWYNGKEPAIERAKSGWGVPGLKSLYGLMPQETDFQKQVQKVLQEEMKYAEAVLQFNPFIGESTVYDSWGKNLDRALRGEISFEEMLASIEEEVNAAIKEGIDRIL